MRVLSCLIYDDAYKFEGIVLYALGWIETFEMFLVIGAILFAGFLANVVFDRTKISQVLILIALGFLLGPVFGVVDTTEGSVLSGLIPFVGTLALIILLFDGGIGLNIFELTQVLPKATAFTVIVFVLSVAGTALLATMFFGWSLLYGLLLGAAIGGSSSAVVLAMTEKEASSSRDTKSVVVLESALTDALCILVAFVVLQLIKAGIPIEVSSVLNLFVGAFSIAILGGIITAVAWLVLLKKLGTKGSPYMLTLAVVFLLYALVESARGNGSIAVFIFGLVLGNAKRLKDAFKWSGDYELNSKIATTQSEVTFFTRTFFFVFLGSILNFHGLSLTLATFAVAVTAFFIFSRYVIKRLLLPGSMNSRLIVSMLPRGLAAAVLAGLPATQGVNIAGFAEIALLVIISTNLVATLGVVFPAPDQKVPVAPSPRVVSSTGLKIHQEKE